MFGSRCGGTDYSPIGHRLSDSFPGWAINIVAQYWSRAGCVALYSLDEGMRVVQTNIKATAPIY